MNMPMCHTSYISNITLHIMSEGRFGLRKSMHILDLHFMFNILGFTKFDYETQIAWQQKLHASINHDVVGLLHTSLCPLRRRTESKCSARCIMRVNAPGSWVITIGQRSDRHNMCINSLSTISISWFMLPSSALCVDEVIYSYQTSHYVNCCLVWFNEAFVVNFTECNRHLIGM